MAKVQRIQPRLSAISSFTNGFLNKMKDFPKTAKWTQIMRELNQVQAIAVQKVYLEHSFHPLQTLGFSLIQIPPVMLFFFTIKEMCATPEFGLSQGGALWFTDLTATDPYFVFPLLCSISTLGLMELSFYLNTPKQRTAIHTTQFMFFRACGVLLLPISSFFPVALLIYWLSSTIVLLNTTLLFETRACRRFFQIPLRSEIREFQEQEETRIWEDQQDLQEKAALWKKELESDLNAIVLEKMWDNVPTESTSVDPQPTLTESTSKDLRTTPTESTSTDPQTTPTESTSTDPQTTPTESASADPHTTPTESTSTDQQTTPTESTSTDPQTKPIESTGMDGQSTSTETKEGRK
eukprot:TRINITY_DN4330_c0_g1_i5.p1 TRINITY_DN4330_c0_g1~~TRINITY_DN4330_c0_g1_i5.p1  ORF type:complete len:351 (+),score=49.46 TRINITY_DN4330_c0_g1_i5:524-1576(+)